MKSLNSLRKTDTVIADLIALEMHRQSDKLSLIPSENFFSTSVREAVGSVLMHKYSEGNIGKRYYEGNEFIDAIETVAQERAAKLFAIPADWAVNVQALSGSNANMSVYLALLEAGDTILSMYLPDGGHLSHGWSYDPVVKSNPNDPVYLGGPRKVNISSRLFNIVQYKTDPETQLFDYENIRRLAQKYHPKLLITGGTAYPRDLDYQKMRDIAHEVGAFYLADIAHEAGLIAAGVLNSPVGIADVVTMTTHKTLRAGRGSIILASKEIITKVNKAVLPGLQGGPFNNNIAGIAVGLGEALQPAFKKYAKQIVLNAQALATALTEKGYKLVTGGTDKHLILIDLSEKGIGGKYAARALNHAGIVLNMNTMPGEKRAPANPSAIRLGTPFITTRGMTEQDMPEIADLIDLVISGVVPFVGLDFDAFEKQVLKLKLVKDTAAKVKAICKKFPLSF